MLKIKLNKLLFRKKWDGLLKKNLKKLSKKKQVKLCINSLCEYVFEKKKKSRYLLDIHGAGDRHRIPIGRQHRNVGRPMVRLIVVNSAVVQGIGTRPVVPNPLPDLFRVAFRRQISHQLTIRHPTVFLTSTPTRAVLTPEMLT